jgi:8-oxo-dGTP pyrophosphatase MutT (NUDIX family)
MTHDPSAPRPASTILLLRDAPELQVLMVKRHHQIDFASGALVFPGGKSHEGDADPAWSDYASGWTGLDPVQRTLRVAAVREVYEEAGILLAHKRDGSGGAIVTEAAERAAVDRGAIAFLDVVRRQDLALALGALTVFARWITPATMPKRFDTFFYAVAAPEDQIASHDGHEAVDAEWVTPREALRLAESGERTIIFPTRMNLQLLAEADSAADAIARAGSRSLVPVLPEVIERDGQRLLTIPADAGYGTIAEPI